MLYDDVLALQTQAKDRSKRGASVGLCLREYCARARRLTAKSSASTAPPQHRYSAAMGQTQTVFLPPWVPSTEAEKRNEVEFRDQIIRLSGAAANLIAPHPLYEDPEFNFDWVEHRPFAEAAYRGDRRLHRLLPKLVPKR